MMLLDEVVSHQSILKVVKFPYSQKDYRDFLVVFRKDLSFEFLH